MNKYFLIVILGVFSLNNNGYAQNQNAIDSLNAILEGKKVGERFAALFELTFQYVGSNKQKALSVIQEAENDALHAKDSFSIVRAKLVKGQILYIIEQPEEARTALHEALPIAEKLGYKHEQTLIEFTLGKLELFQGEYDKALRLYFRTLELAKVSEDTEHVSLALHSIGITYYKLKDYPKGLAYMERSLQAHNFDPKEGYYMWTNLGLCYAQLGDYAKARYYVARSYKDCGSDCSERNRINIEYANGVIALGEKNYFTAERHFLTSYSLAKKVNNPRFQLDNIYLLSEIYIQRKQFRKAKLLLLDAEKIIDANVPFNLEVIKIYHRFSELYLDLNNYKAASFYQSKYIQLKDSIYSEELTNNLMKIEAEHLERENRAKIEAQEDIILLSEEIIHRQWALNLAMGTLGAVVLAFLLFILRNYRRKQNINLLLERKVRERTLQLEISCDALEKAIREKDFRIDRAKVVIMGALSTVNGLSVAANLEVSDPTGLMYVNKVANTFRRASENLQSLIGEEVSSR